MRLTHLPTTEARYSQLRKFFSLWIIFYVYVYVATSQFGRSAIWLEEFVIWFGTKFLHIQDLQKIKLTGSGDTTYHYVLVFVCVLFSYGAGAITLFIDQRRSNYRQFYLFTIVLARYFVGYTLIVYGLAKVFDGQFPANSYQRLDTRIGDITPMGIVWTMMGASRPYTFVSGLLELIGGLLLLFRRTKTFGALFSMTVMINVALLNYMYDVPVKLFSTHIVLFCVFILTYEWRTLFDFFIRHKTTTLVFSRFWLRKKWMYYVLRAAKFVVIGLIFYSVIPPLWATLDKPRVPLEGAYIVHSFEVRSPDSTLLNNPPDSASWLNIYIERVGEATVRFKNDDLMALNTGIGWQSTGMTLYNADHKVFMETKYQQPTDTIVFSGKINDNLVYIKTTRKGKDDYRLLKTRFKWINEYPNNGRKR